MLIFAISNYPLRLLIDSCISHKYMKMKSYFDKWMKINNKMILSGELQLRKLQKRKHGKIQAEQVYGLFYLFVIRFCNKMKPIKFWI